MATGSDNFTGTNGTNLGSHSASDGVHTWTDWSLSGGSLIIQSNALVPPSTPGFGQYDFSVGVSDSIQNISWRRTGAPASGGEGSIWLVSRIYRSPYDSTFAGYTVRLVLSGTPTIKLDRFGTSVLDPMTFIPAAALGSVPMPGSLDTATHQLRFEIVGSLLSVFFDNVLAIRVSDTAISGAAEPMLGATGDNVRLDDYALTDSGYVAGFQASFLQPVATRSRLTFGATQLGSAGGNGAAPVEGQLWPRGQKAG